jgi:ribosomal protein L7Ae-like RNA K-turn-binding protein
MQDEEFGEDTGPVPGISLSIGTDAKGNRQYMRGTQDVTEEFRQAQAAQQQAQEAEQPDPVSDEEIQFGFQAVFARLQRLEAALVYLADATLPSRDARVVFEILEESPPENPPA